MIKPNRSDTPSLRETRALLSCYLYTPATRLEALAIKAELIEAEALVVDLEDSIHVSAKTVAREVVSHFDFSSLTARGLDIGIRINTIRSFEGLADLEMLRTMAERDAIPFSFVVLPKIRNNIEVDVYRSLFTKTKFEPRLISFIETVDAVEDADAIASVSDGLCYGHADLEAELYSANQTYLEIAQARLCVAAAKYRIPAIDTSSLEIDDMSVVEAHCTSARSNGFTGKAAIHPRQVPVINRVFVMPAETLAEYERTVTDYQQQDSGFRIIDNRVIAPPFVAKARLMIESYRRKQDRLGPAHRRAGTR